MGHGQLKQYGSGTCAWVVDPELINPHSVVYSFGVGEDMSFDMDLYDNHGCTVLLFDPTPRSIEYYSNQFSADIPTTFIFEEVGLSNHDGYLLMEQPERQEWVSYREVTTESDTTIQCKVQKLKTIMESKGHSHIDLLKMDIEGSEFSVVEDMINDGIFPTQLLVEYHERFDDYSVEDKEKSVKLLVDNGYDIAWTNMQEFTFIRGEST